LAEHPSHRRLLSHVNEASAVDITVEARVSCTDNTTDNTVQLLAAG
jgi:hypothetical protein